MNKELIQKIAAISLIPVLIITIALANSLGNTKEKLQEEINKYESMLKLKSDVVALMATYKTALDMTRELTLDYDELVKKNCLIPNIDKEEVDGRMKDIVYKLVYLYSRGIEADTELENLKQSIK